MAFRRSRELCHGAGGREQDRGGVEIGKQDPFGAGAALGLAQLFLTAPSPSPREDLGTGLVVPSDKMQIN